MGERIFTREDAKMMVHAEKMKLPPDFSVIGKGSLAGFSQVKDLTVPEGFTRICSHAFFIRIYKGKSTLERLSLPASLKQFDRWCFFDCTALKTVNLPDGFDEKLAMEMFFQTPSAVLNFGKKGLFSAAKSSKTVQQIMDQTSGILTLFKGEGKKINGKLDFTYPLTIPVDVKSHNVRLEIEHFLDALIKGEKSPVSSMEGASTVAVCNAAIESAHTGKPVTVKYPEV